MKIEITKRTVFGFVDFFAKPKNFPSPMGYGKTEKEAIKNLKFKLLEEQETSEETYVVNIKLFPNKKDK